MKSLLFSLIFCFTLQAQSELIIMMGDIATTVVPDEMETTRYLAALTTPLSDSQEVNINTFIRMLKDSLAIDSLPQKFDVMYLFANETSEAGLLNLVKRDNDAEVLQATVTFTAWQGFAGDGVGGIITTNYNPSTEGNNYTVNNASFGLYSRTNSAAAVRDGGGADGTQSTVLAIKWSDNNTYSIINNLSNLSPAMSSSAGLHIITRTAAAVAKRYYNADSLATDTDAAIGIPNKNFYVCAPNGSATFSNRQFAFAFLGAGFTTTEIRKINNCVEWYMDEIGAGVE